MKSLIFVFLTIFFVAGVSGISSDIQETYQPDQTIIFEITGEVISPINPAQVSLKRENVNLAFEYGVENLGGRHFIWLIAPEDISNYTIYIEDILARENGVVQEVDFRANFSLQGNKSDYSIKPGAISSSQDFSIVIDLNLDTPQEINIDLIENSVLLSPGENEIDFEIENVVGTGFIFINVGEYPLPAYLVGQGSEQDGGGEVVIIPSEEDDSEMASEPLEGEGVQRFEFSSSVIRSTNIIGSEPRDLEFEIFNSGNVSVFPEFNYNRAKIRISPESRRIISPGESFEYGISILVEEDFREAVIAYSGNYSDYFLVLANFTSISEEAAVDYFDDDEGQGYYYCSELQGSICGSQETCSEPGVVSLDGSCCLAQCEQSSGNGISWMGWVLALVAIAIVVFIYLKYRKAGSVSGRSFARKRFSSAERNLKN